MTNRERIIGKIEELEKALQELKIELIEEGKSYNKREINVRDEVTILNPRKGQKNQGTVCKYSKVTGFVTIQTDKGKVVRTRGNVALKQNE